MCHKPPKSPAEVICILRETLDRLEHEPDAAVEAAAHAEFKRILESRIESLEAELAKARALVLGEPRLSQLV